MRKLSTAHYILSKGKSVDIYYTICVNAIIIYLFTSSWLFAFWAAYGWWDE